MQMLYNSDQFVVVQIDLPQADGEDLAAGTALRRGGYEIVDKFARKEIFLEGALAQSFREGVDALVQDGPSEEALDDFIGRFSALMQQPVVMH